MSFLNDTPKLSSLPHENPIAMAQAQKKCKFCKQRFDSSTGRRNTCSPYCFQQMQRTAGYHVENKPVKEKKPKPEQKPLEPLYLPTPEEIKEQMALIRSGRLFVTQKGATYLW